MPDLGPYGFYVLTSYAATLAVIGALVGLSLRAGVKAKRELETLEARHGRRRSR
ncbi:MAG: heme exporter protein CcmD [Pseudomonadota bacterium]